MSLISERSVEFAPLEPVSVKPNFSVAGGGGQFMDLAGDGQPDLMVLDGPMPGLYEHDDAEGWLPFRSFTASLQRHMGDPNLKLLDLDGRKAAPALERVLKSGGSSPNRVDWSGSALTPRMNTTMASTTVMIARTLRTTRKMH